MKRGMNLEERFWSRVEKTEQGCWNWKGVPNSSGYGWMRANGKAQAAHRLAWMISFGEIPTGICVLHKCDNRVCVRPEHLFLGTVCDNNRDREAKGRGKQPKWEKHGRAKLTFGEAQFIRSIWNAGGVSIGRIARVFRVGRSTVSRVVHHLNWKIA